MTETLHVITGCMFSGKTDELLRIIERARYAGIKAQVFKPDIDNRWNAIKQVAAHTGRKCKAIPIPITKPQVLFERLKKDTKLVAVDEVQFFGPEIIDVIKEALAKYIAVIAAGLQRDFKDEPFGSMPLLLTMADNITVLNAICTFEREGKICGLPATKTQRLINGQPANYNDPVVLIGAEESYAARCPKHHVVPGKP